MLNYPFNFRFLKYFYNHIYNIIKNFFTFVFIFLIKIFFLWGRVRLNIKKKLRHHNFVVTTRHSYPLVIILLKNCKNYLP